MKKISLLAVLCVISASTACSQDFGNHSWGDSMEKVKATEGNKEWKELEAAEDFTKRIYYKNAFMGLDANVLFQFFENQLSFISITFTEKFHNGDDYMAEYNRINTSLQTEYGSAKVEKHWSVDTYKDSIDKWGQALIEGHLDMYTEWKIPNVEAPRTLIDHSIGDNDSNIIHGIRYFSVDLSTLLEEGKIKNRF
jgi:hypothetical protein